MPKRPKGGRDRLGRDVCQDTPESALLDLAYIFGD
jgi:hypothetical protein